MRFSLTIKLFLIVVLVFAGIFSVAYLANAKGVGESCAKSEECDGYPGDTACDHGVCRGRHEQPCTTDEDCCTGTVCDEDGKCKGGLFTDGQRAVCLVEGNCNRCDLLIVVKNVFQLLVQIAGALAVLSIVIAGIMYMIGGGGLGPLTTQAASPGVQKAKNALTAAIVGLLIVLFAWTMITWLMNFLGYTNLENTPWYQIQCGPVYCCECDCNRAEVKENYPSLSKCQNECKDGETCPQGTTSNCKCTEGPCKTGP